MFFYNVAIDEAYLPVNVLKLIAIINLEINAN